MKWCLVILCMMLLTVVTAEAHRLIVDWMIQESVMEIRARAGEEPAAGAEVQVRNAAGVVLAEGALDSNGAYRWNWNGEAPIELEIDAGLGHRRSLKLQAEDLRSQGRGDAASSTPGAVNAVRGSSESIFGDTVRVGLGLTFLLALSAAWMSYRNSRRLARIEKQLNRHEG